MTTCSARKAQEWRRAKQASSTLTEYELCLLRAADHFSLALWKITISHFLPIDVHIRLMPLSCIVLLKIQVRKSNVELTEVLSLCWHCRSHGLRLCTGKMHLISSSPCRPLDSESVYMNPLGWSVASSSFQWAHFLHQWRKSLMMVRRSSFLLWCYLLFRFFV